MNHFFQIVEFLSQVGGYIVANRDMSLTSNKQNETTNYNTEFSSMMDKMNCGKEEMDKMMELANNEYPYLENKQQAIYLIAQQRRLQFAYDNSGEMRQLEEIDEDLDIDLDKFIQ